MALTNNNLELIKAVAGNNLFSAKKAAMASLMEDTTKKNEYIVKQYKKILSGNASDIISNLPSDLKTILVGEVPAGFDSARYYVRQAEEEIVSDVIKMRLVAEEMSRLRIPYKNTTLLYGESGTGKTELGRYMAYKMRLPFFYISFSSAIDSYMGSTAKNIHKIFNFCNAFPCVLMLDEVDCIAVKRASSGSRGVDGELERTTISLIQELDRISNHVVLIAATNRPDIVDEALLRRFSIKHKVENMSPAELEGMMRQFTEATNTSQYLDNSFVHELAVNYSNPGQVMPELIKTIGKAMFKQKKDLLANSDVKQESSSDWTVTYTWTSDISAETEEDAIAIAMHNRRYLPGNTGKEQYSAKKISSKEKIAANGVSNGRLQ